MRRQAKGEQQKSVRASTSRPTTQATKRSDLTTTRRPIEGYPTKKPTASSIGQGTAKASTTNRPNNGVTSRRTSARTTSKPTARATTSANEGNEKREEKHQSSKGRDGKEQGQSKGEDDSLQAKHRRCAVVKMKSRCGWNSSMHCKWVEDGCKYMGGSGGFQDGKQRGVSGSVGRSSADNGFQNNDQLGLILLVIILVMKLFRF